MAQPSDSATLLQSTVVDTIGSEIVTGTLSVDQRFTLQDIGARFGISRTVAREAMRALEQLGLIMSSRRVGLTVQPISEWNLFDPLVIGWRMRSERTRAEQLRSLNNMRLAVEPIAARLASTHASPEQARKLVELAHRLQELEVNPSPRVGEELSVDLSFHTLILQASGDQMFAGLAPSLLAMFKGKSVFGSRKRDPIAGTTQLHLELAQAIHDRQGERAERLARAILDEARAHVV
ncbi:FadR/GntR family transcriptional regulator [Corynebacterium lizhenjunii]|uniref:FadR/GntR family transcriptional regulator n=1 Tax=Corynebacterium lizhenjunii TaxID=2709394 RepID=UPI0013EA46FE|nr:FCD domain-containing protein [Corynebacterium lizhenjunii]